MPVKLPPKLFEEIATTCYPHLRTEQEREAQLASPLGQWSGCPQIDWAGSAYVFTRRLIKQLPPAELKAVLNSFIVGAEQQPQIAQLCQRIDTIHALTETSLDEPLRQLHLETIDILSAPKYQIDDRFVKLTLLLDHGPDAQGVRFVQDEKRGKYDNLLTLLNDVEDRALVLLGNPGGGKTTLLRRLQLELAWQELEEPNGRTAVAVVWLILKKEVNSFTVSFDKKTNKTRHFQ